MQIRLVATVAVSLFLAGCATPGVSPASQSGESFADFSKRLETAAIAIMNGDTKPWDEIYSHEADATLFGGWGGVGEKGWDQLSERWRMVAGRYRSSTLQIQPISEHINGDMAVTVQIWRGEATFADGSGGPIALRVTHVCRRENGRWRLVHRHADEQLKLQPIKSHLLTPDGSKPVQP